MVIRWFYCNCDRWFGTFLFLLFQKNIGNLFIIPTDGLIFSRPGWLKLQPGKITWRKTAKLVHSEGTAEGLIWYGCWSCSWHQWSCSQENRGTGAHGWLLALSGGVHMAFSRKKQWNLNMSWICLANCLTCCMTPFWVKKQKQWWTTSSFGGLPMVIGDGFCAANPRCLRMFTCLTSCDTRFGILFYGCSSLDNFWAGIPNKDLRKKHFPSWIVHHWMLSLLAQ